MRPLRIGNCDFVSMNIDSSLAMHKTAKDSIRVTFIIAAQVLSQPLRKIRNSLFVYPKICDAQPLSYLFIPHCKSRFHAVYRFSAQIMCDSKQPPVIRYRFTNAFDDCFGVLITDSVILRCFDCQFEID